MLAQNIDSHEPPLLYHVIKLNLLFSFLAPSLYLDLHEKLIVSILRPIVFPSFMEIPLEGFV